MTGFEAYKKDITMLKKTYVLLFFLRFLFLLAAAINMLRLLVSIDKQAPFSSIIIITLFEAFFLICVFLPIKIIKQHFKVVTFICYIALFYPIVRKLEHGMWITGFDIRYEFEFIIVPLLTIAYISLCKRLMK